MGGIREEKEVSDLDDKLRKILDWQGKTHWQILRADTSKQASELLKKDTEVNVALIRQAFLNEGWVHIPQVYIKTAPRDAPEVITVNGRRLMTGAGWYERFKDILTKTYDLRSPEFTSVQALEAAKEASES